MIFYFKIQLTLSHFKSILMNKKSESANTSNIFQNTEKKMKNEILISVSSESEKNSSFVNIFDIYGPSLSKNYLVKISCFPLRTSQR